MVEAVENKTSFKKTEIGLIPEDWEVVNLTAIGKSLAGLTYSPNNVKPYGTLVLRSSNVQQGRLSFENNVFVEMDLPSRVIVKEGDILICVRNGSKNLIGKCALIDKRTEGSAFGAFMSVFRAENPAFAFFMFQSGVIQNQINQALGATINQITNKDLAGFLIPLPPTKAEQTAIATALSDMDALIEAQERLIAKKRAIKQGAMQELLKPKEGWEEEELGKKADVLRGGSPRPIDFFLTKDQNGFNWVKIGDVKRGAKYITSTEERIKQSGIAFSRMVNKGDFLLSNSMSFGRPYIMNIQGCIHDGWLTIQNYQKTFNTEFLYYILGFESTLNQYKKLAAGSTVLNLNKEIVSHVQISFPALSEQIHIAKILSDMDSEIEQLETQLAKYRELKVGMMQELLTGKKRLV